MTEVAKLTAQVGYDFDDSGAKRWERRFEQLRHQSREPVKAKLGAELVDENAIRSYNQQLDRIKARTRRRDEFKAKLGADFDARAFTAFQREEDRARRALEQHSRRLDQAERSSSRLAGTTGRLGGALKRLAGGAGVGAAFGGVAAVGLALERVGSATVGFDRGMRNVNSIAQLSEKRLGTLSKRVLDLAGRTAQAPQTLAAGLYDLVSSGFDADESMKILASSAKAATAGLTTTEVSTKAVAAVLNAYHRPARDAAQISDQLFQTVNLGVLSFEDLAQNIGDVLPFASSLGVGLDQVGASISTMTKAGISAPETMTRIKNVMVALLKPGEDLAKAIHDTGYESGEALVRHKGLQGGLEALIGTTDGSKAAVAKLFPDIRGLGGALALTGRNAHGAEKDLEGFRKSGGATDKALSQQSQSISYRWNKVKAQFAAISIELGAKLGPAAIQAMKSVGRFVEEMVHGTGQGGRFADKLRDAGTRAKDLFGRLKAGAEFIRDHAKLIKLAAEAWIGYKGAVIGAGAVTKGQAIFGAIRGRPAAPTGNVAGGAAAGATAGPLGAAIGAALGIAITGALESTIRNRLRHKSFIGARVNDELRAIKPGQSLEAVISQLDRAQTGFQDMADAGDRGSKDWQRAANRVGATKGDFRAVASAIGRMETDVTTDIRSLRTNVAQNMRLIKKRLGEDSDAGRSALSRNFRAARTAIENSMNLGTISVRDGLKEIRKLMRQELKLYGVSGGVADAIIKHGNINPQEGTGTRRQRGGWIRRAAGGWIGARGMVSDDVVPIGPGALAAYGEYDAHGPGGRRAILTRHQAPFADLALAMGGYPGLDQLPAGRQLPYIEQALGGPGALDGLFASITRPHMYQGGGIVPVPGFPGERAASSVIGKILAIAKRFRLTLTDAFGPGHKSPGHTIYGTDADFAGPNANMDRAVAYLVGQGYLVGYDGRFGSQRWPGHGPTSVAGSNAHLHVALGGKGGAIGAMLRRIIAPRTGAQGALGAIAQRALNVGAAGANRALERAALAPVAGGGSGTAGLFSVEAMAGLWRRAGGPSNIAPLMGHVGDAESGGDPNAYNPSGATGLWQILGQLVPGNLRNALVNAKNAVAKWRGAGLRPWDASRSVWGRFAARGGRILRRFQGGGRGSLDEQIATAQGGTPGPEHGPTRLTIRSLNRGAADQIGDYNAALKEVERERKHYEQLDRRYNQSEEVFINPETGEIDAAAIEKRAGELDRLMRVRKHIKELLEKARRVARRVVRSYTAIINRLRRSLRHAKKKDRSGIRAQIKTFRGKRQSWRETISDTIGPDTIDAELDIGDLRKEGGELRGLRAEPQDNAAGDTSVEDAATADQAEPSPNAQAIADQATARADKLQADLSAAQASLSAFRSSGDIGTGGFANAFAAGAWAGAVGTGPTGPSGHPKTPGLPTGIEHAPITIEIRSFVPPSPVEAARLGRAAAAGLDAAVARRGDIRELVP